MFLQLINIETRKLIKHPMLWLALAGLFGLIGCYFAARYAIMANSIQHEPVDTHGLELDLHVGLGLFGFINIIFCAAAAALISANDFPDRGVQVWLARGTPRGLLMAARLVVILFFGFVVVITAAFAILGFAALMRTLFLGGYSTQNLDWSQILPASLRIFWGTVPYMALTVLLAVVSRSPLFSTGGALVFRAVVENLLAHLVERFPYFTRLLPSQLAFVLEFYTFSLDRTARTMTPGSQFLSEPQAVLAIGAMLLFFGGLSIFIFSRQDWGG